MTVAPGGEYKTDININLFRSVPFVCPRNVRCEKREKTLARGRDCESRDCDLMKFSTENVLVIYYKLCANFVVPSSRELCENFIST